jgi:anti-sigma regulatory factor (Ser/Thr protein kinase)/predicted transcriptional regulator
MPEIHEYLKDQRFSEIIGNIKACDFMKKEPHTMKKDALMVDAKELMRKKKISGIPIVDDDHVINGLISIEDIIISLEEGTLQDQIQKHMTEQRDLVTINHEDKLSRILEYFFTYPYGRFPVLDDNNKVVGIITKGDLTLHILERFGSVYLHNKRRDETLTVDTGIHSLESLGDEQCFFFYIDDHDLDSAGTGAANLKKFLKNRNYTQDIIQKVSIAVYEAEVNVVIHAGGNGKIKVYMTPDIILAFVEDNGPGISDLELAMKEGWTTATDEIREHGFGAGMGLPNMKKYADKLVVLSDSKGTRIEMLFSVLQNTNGSNNGN